MAAAVALPRGLGGVEAILRRYKRACERRALWTNLYREAYDYALPHRQSFVEQAEGQERGQELYDSTAETAVLEFASRLQATITPPWRNWSTLTPGWGLSKEGREDAQLQKLLMQHTELFFAYLNHSNFALRSHEAFLDLAVGMGALRFDLDESGDGFQFECIPISRLAIEEGPTGTVETTFEDKRLPVRSIQRMYRGQMELPPDWLRKGQENVEKCFVQGVIYEPKTRTYHLVVFTEQQRKVLYSAELGDTSPDIVFRWTVSPGEVYGRGPVLSALPDIRTLNKVQEYMLRGAALNLAPPLTGVSDSVLNPFAAFIAPDTIIPVASNDQSNPSLRPLLTQIRPDLGQFVLEDMRRAVRQKLLADPRRREGPIQSATEVLVEDREFVQMTGAAFGRIEAELLVKLINRGVSLLQRIGRMDKFRVDGKLVDIRHTSPLARAQDNEELMALERFVGMSRAAAGDEAYMLGVKIEELPAFIGRKTGVPSELIRDEQERNERLAQVADAARQAQQAQQPDAGMTQAP